MSETKNENGKSKKEEFILAGSEVIEKIKAIISEGNARRIILKGEDGKILVEFPLTLGIVGVALAPVLAAVGAIAALVAKLTLVVEKDDDDHDDKEEAVEKTDSGQ